MADMLASLVDLPDIRPLIAKQREEGIVIRRAHTFELTPVREFILKHFGVGWADETSAGFANKPVTVFIAIDQTGQKSKIVGFAAYECTCRDFFGPTGVDPEYRGRGIGKALLLAALHGLRELGYAYAIIGGVGPSEFYKKCCGAIEIPNSTPGIYRDMLKR